MEEKITNRAVLEGFGIKFVSNYITRRRLSLIGGIIRMNEDRVPARLITAFYYTKRPVGKPNNSVWYSFISDIKKIIPFIDDQGSLNTLGRIAYDELIWSQLVNNLDDKDFEYDFTQKTSIIIQLQTHQYKI